MKRILKLIFYFLGIPLLIGMLALAGVGIYYYTIVKAEPGQLSVTAQPGELGRWVDPFIGTGGYPWMCAHNFPGAMTPFGMVRLSPETASILLKKKALNTSGYFYGDDKIIGFSHTRLVGTGAVDGGHFLVIPAAGKVAEERYADGFYFRFSHKKERAFPGYYAVELSGPKVLVELTATPRVGVHRYTFRGHDEPHILIDVSHALGDARSQEARVRILPDAREIEGQVRTFGTFARRYGGIKVYFVARFDQPFQSFGTWKDGIFTANSVSAADGKIGVDVSFAEKSIVLKLAISYVSIDNARENLQAEAADRSFDQIFAEGRAAWEDRLATIRIKGGSEKQRRIFYTALYRVFQMPTVFNDVNGDYLGFDKQVHRAEGFRYFTDMSLWDTFRTVHPLYTLIAPKDQLDMLVSLVHMARQGGGWLPRWPSGAGYTNSMLGTPADIVIAESYLKGIRNFDVHSAYRAMRRTALAPTPRGAAYSGREGVEYYLKYGYCPAELMDEAVARTLEFAWADRAIANLAAALGYDGDADLFAEHARFYRNVWNSDTQYFQPRDTTGKFVEPFKPLLLTYLDKDGRYTNDYVEGSALQWRWAAFYDARGMISLFKSKNYFVDELNEFFARSDDELMRWKPSSYYWHGNEPDMHAAYLFNEAGRPDLTQKWVRWIMDTKYDDNFIGLSGNDDAATLSAWYVFSALGFYPVAGTDRYELAAPLFPRAEIDVRTRRLTILAENYAPGNIYVRKVWLNDSLLDRTWMKHEEIARGGVLRFDMASEPMRF